MNGRCGPAAEPGMAGESNAMDARGLFAQGGVDAALLLLAVSLGRVLQLVLRNGRFTLWRRE